MRLCFVFALFCASPAWADCAQLAKAESVVLAYGDLVLPGGRIESEATCIQRGTPTVIETRLRPNGEPLRQEFVGGRLVSMSIDKGAFNTRFRTFNAKGNPESLLPGTHVSFDMARSYAGGRPSVTIHIERDIEAAGSVEISGCHFELLRVRLLWQEPSRTARWDTLLSPKLNHPIQSRVFLLDPKSLQDVREEFRSRITQIAPEEEAERICHPKPLS